MRLLLIEDDEVISRELILRWLPRAWVVHSVGTLREASSVLSHGPVDLVVLDLGLPDGDGLEWLAQWRRDDRITPVLVLTARDRVIDRVQGLRLGADDYLVKPFASDELDARVEALARRGQITRGESAHFAGITWLQGEAQAYVHGKALPMSRREFEVLGVLIRRAPRLVPKRVLVDLLAERNVEVGDAAVEVYVSRLRRRLADSGAEIRTLRGFGYQLVLSESPAPGAPPGSTPP